jgi:nicotinamide mononucleotide transporter
VIAVLAAGTGLVVSGVVYAIFFMLVLIGLRGWLRQDRAQTAVAPDLKAVAA